MVFGLSYLPTLPTVYIFPSSRKPPLPIPSYISAFPISFYSSMQNMDTQNPLMPSVIAIYILCRFVFSATKPPGGLIGQK